MKLGIFGGTFDPPHLGHLVLAERAREQLNLHQVLWLPAGMPWRKPDRSISEARHRIEMVRRAVDGNDAFRLSTIEVDRDGPSYSVDTLEALRGSELYFVLGLDALRDLPNWKEPARVVDLAVMAVASRDGERLADDELEALVPGLPRRVAWIDMPRLDISGTEIRNRAARGRSLRYVLRDTVVEYITEQRLYS